MATPLKVLLVEDNEDDALLLLRELRKAGYEPSASRVETLEELDACLSRDHWDIVISDYTLPRFSCPAALAHVQGTGRDIPFIIASGTIGEHVAVSMMKAGAHDYLLKNDLARLGPAVERELREAQSRRQRREAEMAFRESEARYRSIVEDVSALICRFLPDGTLTFVNSAFCAFYGSSFDDLLGQSIFQFIPELECERIRQQYKTLSRNNPSITYEHQATDSHGGARWQRWTDRALFDDQGALAEFQSVGFDITERKKVEEDLSASEERFRTLVNNTPVGISRTTPGKHGVFIMANPALAKMLGFEKAEDLIGRPVVGILFNPKGRDIYYQAVHAFGLQVPEVQKANEIHLVRKDGSDFWASVTARAIKDDAGETIYFDGMIEDISDRKKAEEERDRLFNTSIDMLSIAGFDGYFRQINPAWIKTLGWSREELLKKTWLELVHPADIEKSIAAGLSLIKGEPMINFENRYLCRDGSIVWLSWNSFPMLDEQLIFSVTRNVTEQKKGEQELMFQSMLLDQIRDHITATDMDGNITYVNNAQAQAFAAAKQNLIGRNVTLYGEDPARGATQQEIITQTNRLGAWRGEIVNKTPGGKEIVMDCHTWVIYDENGKRQGLCGISTDVTDRKAAQRQLEENAAKLKALTQRLIALQEEERLRLSRELHDELGQRLTSLSMKIECMRGPSPVDAEQIESLAAIIENVNVELHRIYHGLRPIIIDKLGLAPALEAMVKEFRERNAFIIHASIVDLQADEISSEMAINIYRIVQETLTNIYKHAKASSASISLARGGGGYILVIEDDGVGFSQDAADGKFSFGFEGMKERAEFLGGVLHVESTPGQGTQVFVKFPKDKRDKL